MSAGTFRMRREAAERAAAEAKAVREATEQPKKAPEPPATVATADAAKPKPKAPSRST